MKWPFKRSREAIKKQATLKPVGLVDLTSQRSSFESPPYNFQTILDAYNTDSYVRQALDKYIELIFKASWVLSGKNAKAINYIRSRFMYMSTVLNKPMEQFFIEMAEDLVKYSNVFIVKSRATIPGVKATGLNGKKPVAGYFLLSPITMQISRDVNGNVLKYRQVLANQTLDLDPADVIHIYYKRERGYAFGTPFLVPVLDDIRLLRQLEENVARMVHKHIFPLYKYKVGLPEAGYEATEEEMLAVQNLLNNMPIDGGIALPERHDIDIIGANSAVLSVAEYLSYFENRVFTGLGVPPNIMGRTDSSNRSTADNMTAEMHDIVQALQKTLSIGIDFYIIRELLLEGGFDPINSQEDIVGFKFNEIDKSSQIASENHAIQKFINNTISHDEFRTEIGMDPASDYAKYFYNLFPKSDLSSAGLVANKDMPANQHGTLQAPKANADINTERG